MDILKPKSLQEKLKSQYYIFEFRNLFVEYILESKNKSIRISSYTFDLDTKTWRRTGKKEKYTDIHKNLPLHKDIELVSVKVTGAIKASKDYSQSSQYEIGLFMKNIYKKLTNVRFKSGDRNKFFVPVIKMLKARNNNTSVSIRYSEKNWFLLEVESLYIVKKYF